MEGVKWTKNGLELSDDMIHHLTNIQFKWIKCNPKEQKILKDDEIFVPLYLNSSRQNLITPIRFKFDASKISDTQLY